MKTRLLLLVCLLACWTVAGYAAGDKKPKDMRILYLAGNSDWNADAVEKSVIEENVAQRKEAFGGLLRKYFGEVAVMDAADYSPEMSEGYDVTVFDGLPPALEPRREEHDPATGKTKYIPARYLPDDFDAPCVTIGVVSAQIGERIGVKNDWFCLCLDACAHHLREGHPIFHGPFKVSLTFEEQPTPDDAFYYQHQFDEPIPKSLPMWRVQTKGYRTDMRFNMGLVSHPWGYEDSPEAEYISGGVSTKSPDAVAIGRHGNFLHWGFIASPLYMTEEAKVMFANAVAYIAQFRGPILARRFDGYMPFNNGAKGNVLSIVYDQANRWTSAEYSGDPSTENPNARFPRLYYGKNENNTKPSTFWMGDARYLRLQELSLNYNLRVPALQRKLGIQSMDIRLVCENLAVWDSVDLFDPEQATACGQSYPLPARYSLQLYLNF